VSTLIVWAKVAISKPLYKYVIPTSVEEKSEATHERSE
jgi:hypothetical protein